MRFLKLTYQLIIAFLICTTSVVAKNPDFSAGLKVDEVISDNVELSGDDAANSDFITVITPSFSIINEGSRLQTQTNYLLQQIIYKNTSGSRLIHTINSDISAEIFKNHFFTDFNIRNGQQNISSSGVIGIDNLSNSRDDNRENVFSYQITPYWIHNIYNYAELTVGHNYNEIISDFSDSKSNTTYITINNGRRFSNISFEVDLRNRFVNTEGNDEIRFTNLTNSIIYPFSEQISLTGKFGYDDNEFLSSGDNSGFLWSIGGIWHPSRRTELRVDYGDRYYGANLDLQGEYKTKKSSFRIKYNRSAETTRNALLNQQSINLQDSFGDLITNPDITNPADLDLGVIDQRDEVVVVDNLVADYNYSHKRNRFGMNVNFTEREFQATNDVEEFFSSRLYWVRNISRKLTSNVNFSYQTRELISTDETDYYIVDYSLSRIIGKTFNLELGLRHVLFESELSNGYKENRAYISLGKTF